MTRTQFAEGAVHTKGRVVFSDGIHAQISVGLPPNPEMNLYMDGHFVRMLNLREGDQVVITLEKEFNETVG